MNPSCVWSGDTLLHLALRTFHILNRTEFTFELFTKFNFCTDKSFFPEAHLKIILRMKFYSHLFLSRHESLLRCSQCKMARYCSAACQVLCVSVCVNIKTSLYSTSVCLPVCWNVRLLQRQAWSVHRTECECLRRLLPRIPTDSVRLSARLIFALVRFPPSDTQSDVNLERQNQFFCTWHFVFLLDFAVAAVFKNPSDLWFFSKTSLCWFPLKD